MPRTTSVRLNEHFAEFVDQQTSSGRYASVDEVIEAGLALLEDRAQEAELEALDFGPAPIWTREALEEAIRIGEESGPAEDFDIKDLVAEVKAEIEAEKRRSR